MSKCNHHKLHISLFSCIPMTVFILMPFLLVAIPLVMHESSINHLVSYVPSWKMQDTLRFGKTKSLKRSRKAKRNMQKWNVRKNASLPDDHSSRPPWSSDFVNAKPFPSIAANVATKAIFGLFERCGSPARESLFGICIAAGLSYAA